MLMVLFLACLGSCAVRSGVGWDGRRWCCLFWGLPRVRLLFEVVECFHCVGLEVELLREEERIEVVFVGVLVFGVVLGCRIGLVLVLAG